MRPLVICASQRFKEPLDAFTPFLQKRGVLVFGPNFRRHRRSSIQKPEHLRLKSLTYKAKVPGMVRAHFDNLDVVKGRGGACLIFNPAPHNQSSQYGYIGSNTQGEIGYAAAIHLPVLLIKPHQEEWIMTVAHHDHNHIFTMKHPKANSLDWDLMWDKWLKTWLQLGGGH